MKKFTSLLTAITVSFPLMSVSQIRQGKTDRSILNIKNRSSFRYLLLSIIFVLMSANVAWGQQSITTAGSATTQNFTSLGSSGTATLPTGFRIGTDWSSGTTATTQAAGTIGTGILTGSSAGGTYNFANGTTASSTERSLGFLTAGGYTSPKSIIYAFTNNTGSTITSIDLAWNYEKSRSGSRAFAWTFFHGNTSTATTAATSGNQSYAADANNTVISNPPLSTAKSFSLTGLSIANGTTYYLRWTYTGSGGSTNAQGLSIDDFSVTLNAPTSSITLADNGTQVGTANVTAGTTNHVLHKFSLAVSTANASLTGLQATTAGTYASADITNLKIRYSADATLDGADATLSTYTSVPTASTLTFPSFTSQTINSGNTGYIFITADIASGATAGNTISVNAITTGQLTFSSGTKSGSTTSGGTQTFSSVSLATPTATAASNVTQTSFTANWNAVSGASCYDLNVYTKTGGGGNATDLFISQYFEGATGTNKVIEIFNGTGASINLGSYSIKKQTNGSGSYADELTLSGTLANNDVYVIASSTADFTGITSTADLLTTSSALTFNGNDAVALFKNSVQIDEVGIFNQTTDWGKDLTLVRNSNVSNPKVTYDLNDWTSTSGGTNAETTNIGSHSFSGGSSTTPISGSPFTITGQSNNSYSITGLTAGNYYYTVLATDCGSSTSGTSNEIEVVGLVAPIATEETNLTSSSFTANWHSVSGALDYELDVYTKTSGSSTLYQKTFTNLTDWTTSGYTAIESGKARLASGSQAGSITSPVLGITGTVTIKFVASYYNTDGSSVTVNKGSTTLATQALTATSTEYTISNVSLTSTDKITFSALQNKRLYIESITILGGGTGTKNYIIQNQSVEDTTYNVSGLNPNTCYYYVVRAKNAMFTSANSNEIEACTSTSSTPTILVSQTVYTFNASVNYTDSKTVTINGSNLTGNITLALGGTNASQFTISSTTISAGTTVTMTYHPDAGGTHTATVTLTSAGASDVVLNLTGNGILLPDVDIVDINSSGTFNLDWNVAGTTAKVYEKSTGSSSYATGLFFSKYFEATGNNKLLEIFNGTNADVNLAGWKVQVYQVGSKNTYSIDWGRTNVTTTPIVYSYSLSGMLTKGSTYVLYSKATTSTCTFDPAWHEASDTILQFNGNDAIRLVNSSGTVVDAFGHQQGTTSKTPWTATVNGVTLTTERSMLIRKTSVVSGANAVSQNTTTFATLGTEWDQYVSDFTEETVTCASLVEFGSFDYGAIYEPWTEIPNAVTNKVATIPNVFARPCEELKVEVLDGSTVQAMRYINVPVMVNSIKNISDASIDSLCSTCDLAVLSGGNLTVNTTGKVARNVYVYPGGNLINSNAITANNLIMKMDEIAETTFGLNLTSGITLSGSAYAVKKIDASRWYFISFPCNVDVTKIKKYDGTTLGTLGTDWFLKYYDGESRTSNLGDTSNWKHIYSGYLQAYQGYIIGLPSDTIEISFPLDNTVVNAETSNGSIPVTAYGSALSIGENHKGWNLIGQPYLSKYSGTNVGVNYMTFSDNGGASTKTYTQLAKASVGNLFPFTSYFVQANDALAVGEISFVTAGRTLAPSIIKNSTPDKVKISFKTSTGEDHTNLVIDDTQNTDYQINEDLEKWLVTGTAKPQVYTKLNGINYAFNALSVSDIVNLPLSVYSKTASQASFSTVASAPNISALYLNDNVTGANVNLLVADYSYTADAGTTSDRFTLTAQRVITGTNIIIDNNIKISTSKDIVRLENIIDGSSVTLFDSVGKNIAKKYSQNNTTEFSNLSKGVYIIQIITEGKRLSYKIIL